MNDTSVISFSMNGKLTPATSQESDRSSKAEYRTMNSRIKRDSFNDKFRNEVLQIRNNIFCFFVSYLFLYIEF